MIRVFAAEKSSSSTTGALHAPAMLATEELFPDPLHIACDDQHRFIRRAAVAWSELAGENVIVLAPNSGVRILIDGAGDRARCRAPLYRSFAAGDGSLDLLRRGSPRPARRATDGEVHVAERLVAPFAVENARRRADAQRRSSSRCRSR